MSILTGSQCASAKPAAVAYCIDGFSVLPLSGKRPALKQWEAYQQRRADIAEIARWFKNDAFLNVGIICGGVSGNLAVMDCDSLQACALFERSFPALLDTFTVATGSGKGKHYYYFVDNLPPTTRALNVAGGNLELRCNGCYVVAPPSIHPDSGLPYKVATSKPIMHLPNLENLKSWIYRFIQAKHTPKPETQERTMRKSTPAGIRNAAAYGAAALQKELTTLRGTPPGGQNNQLNISAYNLGQLVGDGILYRQPVEESLLAVAVQIGQDESQSRRTIESGLNRGIAATRSAQWSQRNTR